MILNQISSEKDASVARTAMNRKRHNALLLLYLLLLLRVHALVIASESQTGNVLLLSDIHFDPLGDTSIVTQLLNNEVSQLA